MTPLSFIAVCGAFQGSQNPSFNIRFDGKENSVLHFGEKKRELHVGGPRGFDLSYKSNGGADISFADTVIEVPAQMRINVDPYVFSSFYSNFWLIFGQL